MDAVATLPSKGREGEAQNLDDGGVREPLAWGALDAVLITAVKGVAKSAHSKIGVLVQFDCGTRILRVIHRRDARATLSN
jgi:hypothetical protein